MKAGLLSIFPNVVTPADFTGGLIKSVESTRTGPDEYQIARDRGDRKDSTTGVVLPDELWRAFRSGVSFSLRLSATRIHRQNNQIESEKKPDHPILHCFSTPS